MNITLNKDALITEIKRYIQWEKQSFDNWEEIEIIIANTLSEAWIIARPNDNYKFEDLNFKDMVDSASGKWLEKQTADDTYKVILSTKYTYSLYDLAKTCIHELRHCLDYKNAVAGLSFNEYHCGNQYYNNWSEFRAVYSHTRYEYFAKCHSEMDSNQKFDILSEILGRESADSVMGLMHSKNNSSDILYYLSRYIGASRAIRNINMENLEANVFHLWYMTPQYIIENYGYVFYIGNEWDEMNICKLDDTPQTYYYTKLLDSI